MALPPLTRRLLLLPVLLLSLLFMPGCPRTAEPVRVGTNVWIGYEPLYLARALGHYDATPLRLVEMGSATEVAQALRAGMLEAATLTLDEALAIRQDGIDLRVVLVMDISAGADALLAHPAVPDLAALRGRRIGVESTATGAVLLTSALEAAGLAADDVTIVHLPIGEHEAAYRSGRVDAVVTYDPIRTRLLAAGAKPLFDSRQIPDRIVDVLVTTPASLARHGPALRALVAGHFAALAHLRAAPDEAAHVMTRRMRISRREVLDALKGLSLPDAAANHRLLGGPAPGLAVPAQQLADLMLARKMLHSAVQTRDMLDPRLLP